MTSEPVGVGGGGPAEREKLLREKIIALPWERFEQLIYTLVKLDHPTAQRMKAPEKGADVLVPTRDGEPALVWQAKHYPKTVNWAKCVKSLTDAISEWKPSHVTFAFTRDFGAGVHKTYEEKLVNNPAARGAGTVVQAWTLSHIVGLLEANPKVARQFFGKPVEDPLDSIERALAAGGKLESSADLVERAKTLGEWAAQTDADFVHKVSAGGPDTPEHVYTENLPYMSVAVRGQEAQVQIDSWVREGAEVPPASFGFVDNDEGHRARDEAVRHLARGEAAPITHGFRVNLRMPEGFEDLARDAQLADGELRIGPNEPVRLGIKIMCPDGELNYAVEMRQVPPMPDANAAFAGYIDTTLVELSIVLRERPRVHVNLSFKAKLGRSAAENALTAGLLWAFHSHTLITLKSERFFPEKGESSGQFGSLSATPGQERMQWLQHFFADVAYLEEQLGLELPIPDAVSDADIQEATAAASLVRTGEATQEPDAYDVTVGSANEIPRVAERVAGAVEHKDAVFSVVGVAINLGPSEQTNPPKLKVIEVVPHGNTPDAGARVRLAPDGDRVLHIRLTNQPE